MIATRQRFAAALLARVASLILALPGAQHLTLLLATVAVLLHLLRARLTLARMADLLAPMLITVERLIADGFALQRLLHGALHQLAGATTATAATHIGLTRRTRSRMAEQRAGVAAALDAATELATTVRQLVARQWRILELATEAEILPRQFLQHILAGRTSPALGRLGAARPRDGALEMQHMVAVLARPCAVMCLDLLHAHETLQPSLLDVSHQFLSLRQLLIVRSASRRDLMLLLLLLRRGLCAVIAVARVQLLCGPWIAIDAIPIAIPVVASLVAAMIVVALLLLWLLAIIAISISIPITIPISVSVSIPVAILVSFNPILAVVVASLLATVASLWLRLPLLGGWRSAASLM